MKVYMHKPYSPLWWEARSHRPTASDFGRILSGGGKVSASQDKYLAELVQGIDARVFSERGRIGTPDMENGRATEPEARACYAMRTNHRVHEVGFVPSDCGEYGCTPDGLVNPKSYDRGRDKFGPYLLCNAEGLVEIKCPKPETQERYLKKPTELPNEYRPQCHGQLIVCAVPYVDFFSYVEGMEPVHVRVFPDSYTQELRAELCRFVVKLRDAMSDAKKRLMEEAANV